MASPHVAGVVALYVAQNGRDVNGDTVVNEDDVKIIRDDLIAIGISQSDPEGFSGDRDSFPEPLVHAKDLQQVPDFSLSANPSSVELEINDSERSTVTVTGRNGFTGTISLSTTTSDDISVVLSPDQVIIDPTNPSAISILTIDSGNTAGDFSITVTGTNSTLSRSTILSVTITNGGGGCLIATAAYGSELSPQVQFLREIRDNTVMSTASGSTFMTGFNQLYYSFSPTIADMERENPMFQELVRAFITPMISTLSIMTLAEDGSEVEVLGLGISVIALNLGMYIAAPTLIGFKVYRHLKTRNYS